jgi:hypothetical protein
VTYPLTFHSQGTCQDTGRGQLPDLTINDLPAEVLLDIFNLYRESLYDYQWTERYAWVNLAHVCRNWRTVVFAHPSHLNLCITVGPRKPNHIETILSGPFQILIDYKYINKDIDRSFTSNPPALRRLHAALKHPDRVRGITFEGTSAGFDKFFEATNCPFPVLESLLLSPALGYELKLPDTFLRGPDLCDLRHLRCLKLYSYSLPPICGFLSSTAALTDLDLVINATNSTSQEPSLLACLQGMPCLHSINLRVSHDIHDSLSHPSTSKAIVPLSKLTSFCYNGRRAFLNFLMAGFLAPSLRNVNIFITDPIWTPIVHLPRFMDAMGVHYHTAYVSFHESKFSVSLVPDSGFLSAPRPRFELGSPPYPTDMIVQICSGLSTTKLTSINELYVIFDHMAELWEDYIPWRSLLQQFPYVKTLRTRGVNSDYVARTLLHQNAEEPDEVLSFLPVLEEIELDKYVFSTLESLQPFVSARQRAGRPVRVLNVRPVRG